MDRRIAISRWRAAARASSSPARFAHAMSSTIRRHGHQHQQHRAQHADAAGRRFGEREDGGRVGISVALLGYWRATAACHERPITRTVRSSRPGRAGRDGQPAGCRAPRADRRRASPPAAAPIGTQRSNRRPDSPPWNAGGATPTIVNGCALNCTLAADGGLGPPKRAASSRGRSPSTASAPRASSEGWSSRPRHGRTPSTSK